MVRFMLRSDLMKIGIGSVGFVPPIDETLCRLSWTGRIDAVIRAQLAPHKRNGTSYMRVVFLSYLP